MTTLRAIRQAATALVAHLDRLERLPSDLQSLRDRGTVILRMMRRRAMERDARGLASAGLNAYVFLLVDGLLPTLRAAGLNDDLNLEQWRAAAKKAVKAAKRQLAAPRRPVPGTATSRNMAAIERSIRRLERGMRLLAPRGRLLREIAKGRKAIEGQLQELRSLPRVEEAFRDVVRSLPPHVARVAADG